MNRYGNGGSYPSCYKDPDITDAEHLTRAAYHMIEAGYGDEALRVVARVTDAFADVPVNPKLKPPAKALGQVRYLPCGILKYSENGREHCVPAPPYSAGNDEQRADQHKKAVAMRAADSVRDARLGWFSCKQASAALAGRLPNTASFRPAAILGKIAMICANYDEAMPKEAAVVLARKLKDVLDKNPLSCMRWTRLRQDLADVDNRYHASDDPGMRFYYLSEQQAELAGSILAQDGRGQAGSLYGLSESVVAWRECNRPALDRAEEILGAEREADRTGVPFLEAKHARQHFVPAPGEPMRYYYASDEYVLSERMQAALRALRDVNNLMRCHQALYRHPDGYLHDILVRTKMIGADIDGAMPPDLYVTAAKLMCARVWAPLETNHMPADPELAAAAESAFALALERAEIASRLDSPLFRPVPEDAGDAEKQENERT